MQLCMSGNANVCLHFGECETNTGTCAVTNVPDPEQQEGKRSRCHQVRLARVSPSITTSQSQLNADFLNFFFCFIVTSGHRSFNRCVCPTDLIDVDNGNVGEHSPL